MMQTLNSFTFDYYGSDIVYGRECIRQLKAHLEQNELERILLICGTNVGANDALMEPVKQSLGDKLVSVFDETTPSKSIETVYAGIEVMEKEDIDANVGVGGGSSLDIARQMSAFKADGRSMGEFRTAAREGCLSPPSVNEQPTPVMVIPTTFAGADMSSGGSIELLSAKESPTNNPIRTRGNVDPNAIFYDPDLYETTPFSPLTGSAMNGFNKAIETIYCRNATPITDGTAVRGLNLLHGNLRKLGTDDPRVMESVVTGNILVQFKRQGAIIHAFGHGLARRYSIQQGIIHAVMAPHVLRYVFQEVDARRKVLAEGLNIDRSLSDSKLASVIIDEVAEIRDELSLPSRLQDIGPIEKEDFPAIAEYILEDSIMERNPEKLDPALEDIENILHEAW